MTGKGKEETKFIAIKDDRLIPSVLRDAMTVISLLGSVGVGILTGSSALQWIGGILWVLWLVGRLQAAGKAHFTINEARAELDRLEHGRSGEPS